MSGTATGASRASWWTSGAELPRGCRRFLDAKDPEGPGERRAELDEEALAAFDAAEIDGAKLSAAVVAAHPES